MFDLLTKDAPELRKKVLDPETAEDENEKKFTSLVKKAFGLDPDMDLPIDDEKK